MGAPARSGVARKIAAQGLRAERVLARMSVGAHPQYRRKCWRDGLSAKARRMVRLGYGDQNHGRLRSYQEVAARLLSKLSFTREHAVAARYRRWVASHSPSHPPCDDARL